MWEGTMWEHILVLELTGNDKCCSHIDVGSGRVPAIKIVIVFCTVLRPVYSNLCDKTAADEGNMTTAESSD